MTDFNDNVQSYNIDPVTLIDEVSADFIFNINTRISASVWSPVADRTVNIWLTIQEI